MIIERMALRSTLAVLVMLVAVGALPVDAAPEVAQMLNVSLFDFKFIPRTIIVQMGDTITWKNNSIYPHTVTANDGSFVSGNLAPDQTFTKTFSQSGVFPYYCQLHGTPTGDGMTGTVIVAAELVYMPLARR